MVTNEFREKILKDLKILEINIELEEATLDIERSHSKSTKSIMMIGVLTLALLWILVTISERQIIFFDIISVSFIVSSLQNQILDVIKSKHNIEKSENKLTEYKEKKSVLNSQLMNLK